MTVNEKIKLYRERKGLSKSELARRLNVSKSTVFKWENGGIENMGRDKIVALAKVLDTTPMDLLGVDWSQSKGIQIPVLGTVRAGIPITAVEEILDYEEISPDMALRGEHFALKVKGDSMSPKIDEGDVVIVRQQSYVDSGDIAIVLINGEDATIKKVTLSDDGIMLTPFNPAYSPMFYTRKQINDLPVAIIGKVVELRAKF